MAEKRKRQVFRETCRRMRGAVLAFVLISGFHLAVFWLYGLALEPFCYGIAVTMVIGVCAFLLIWNRETERAARRDHLLAVPEDTRAELPKPESLEAYDLQEMILRLRTQADRLAADFDRERLDMRNYYTTWVHQIKTPIAVMRMTMGAEDSPMTEELSMELFRIEQYVDMVLQYIRLGSDSNDLVICEYDLDELIRETIRKFAPQFIGRQLRLTFEPTGRRIVTDRKWLTCILEQILSNAVKYTPAGGVTIRWEGGELRITDTGIGIAPEDLPRIFEKGYTGSNGRMGMKSSGLGLYLCRRAAEQLHIGLRAESRVGEGTSFYLDLSQDKNTAGTAN